MPATREASRVFSCISPEAAPGLTSFKLHADGMVSTTALPFRYVSVAETTAIAPAVVSSRGGTRVEVHGRNFVASLDLGCSFGSTLTRAEWISSVLIVCISPPHTSDLVEVKATNDGITLRGAATLSYVNLPNVSHVTPLGGPRLGNTLVTLSGRGFNSSTTPVCRFGAMTTAATVFSDAQLRCLAPPQQESLPTSRLGAISVLQQSISVGNAVFQS